MHHPNGGWPSNISEPSTVLLISGGIKHYKHIVFLFQGFPLLYCIVSVGNIVTPEVGKLTVFLLNSGRQQFVA